MPSLVDLKIINKFLLVIALVASIIGGCAWYATSQMTVIDDAYSMFLAKDARAVSTARRLNRVVYQMTYVAFRVVAETDRTDMRTVDATFDPLKAQAAAMIAEMRGNAPAFRSRIDQVAAAFDTSPATSIRCDPSPCAS